MVISMKNEILSSFRFKCYIFIFILFGIWGIVMNQPFIVVYIIVTCIILYLYAIVPFKDDKNV